MTDPKMYDLFLDMLESLNDAIVIDKDEKIIFFSESYGKDVNVDPKDVLGKKVTDVISNTKMHEVLHSGQGQFGEGLSAEFLIPSNDKLISAGKTPYHFCNRIPIRKNGDESGEILGVFAFSILETQEMFLKIKNALEDLEEKEHLISEQLSEFFKPSFLIDSIKGSSTAVCDLRENITRIAPSDITVSITGETGTGKELIASSIHALSKRQGKPFVKINCAAIPDNLLESELFGYEPGSFTGASKTGKRGKFEIANNGTILLDEIGDMPLHLQSKLLRVLQEREVERIGGNKPIPINVRIICATNKNLKSLVSSGKLREDLYYRINVMEIHAPTLRERIEDIPELCDYFIKKNHDSKRGNAKRISGDAIRFLQSYDWPGNIRELEHVIECACVMSDKYELTVSDFYFLHRRMHNDQSANMQFPEIMVCEEQEQLYAFPTSLMSEYNNASANSNIRHISDVTSLASEKERELIINSLESNHYNISAASAELGINRTTLYRKLKSYKIFPYDK